MHHVTTTQTGPKAADVRFFDVHLLVFEARRAYLHDAGFHTITPSRARSVSTISATASVIWTLEVPLFVA
jgi:hypothetical protein